jgi:hypothetical protein
MPRPILASSTRSPSGYDAESIMGSPMFELHLSGAA